VLPTFGRTGSGGIAPDTGWQAIEVVTVPVDAYVDDATAA